MVGQRWSRGVTGEKCGTHIAWLHDEVPAMKQGLESNCLLSELCLQLVTCL